MPNDAPSAIRDLDAERAMKMSSSLSEPAPPVPPPELTKSGKPLTKKEKKAVCSGYPISCRCICKTDFRSYQLKERTAGPKWFDLPAPAETDLPRLYKEYQALRLRNQLDPKRFYRKDPGEGRGIKSLPKHFAVRVHPGVLLLLTFPLNNGLTDWYNHSNEHTVCRTECGQSAALDSQAHACRRVS
jgi:hypothetical protein